MESMINVILWTCINLGGIDRCEDADKKVTCYINLGSGGIWCMKDKSIHSNIFIEEVNNGSNQK